MGKLIDILNRLGQTTGPRLGFGASGDDDRPSLAIVAILDKATKDLAAAATKAGAVAVVAPPGGRKSGSLRKTLGLGDGVACGASGPHSGADFVLTGMADPLASPEEGAEQDLVLRLPQEVSGNLLRTLESLPADAVVVEAGAPATLQDLVPYYRVARATSKPVLALVEPEQVQQDHLLHMRNAGVSGLLVELSASGVDALKALRQTVAGMPPPRPRPEKGRRQAVLGLPGRAFVPDEAPDEAPDEGPDEDA